MINEIIIIEFLYSGSVTFQWTNNISSCMICGILVSKVEFLCNFFTFSDINWSVENSSSNLNLLLSSNLRFVMPLWLFNMFFLNNRFRLGLRDWFFINFTDNSNALDWWDISSWFFVINFGFLFNFWLVFNLRLYFWLYFRLVIFGCIYWLIWVRRWDIYWLGRWRGWFNNRFLNWWFLLLSGWFLLLRGSSDYWFHSTEKKIIHIFFKVGFFSIGIKRLFLVFRYGFVIIINSKTSSNLRHVK